MSPVSFGSSLVGNALALAQFLLWRAAQAACRTMVILLS